jgi:hypothetical protein
MVLSNRLHLRFRALDERLKFGHELYRVAKNLGTNSNGSFLEAPIFKMTY